MIECNLWLYYVPDKFTEPFSPASIVVYCKGHDEVIASLDPIDEQKYLVALKEVVDEHVRVNENKQAQQEDGRPPE